MSFIDNLFEKLFGGKKSDNSGSSNPYIHEMLVRKESEIAEYEEWKISPEKNAILNFIYRQYELSKSGDEDQSMIRVLIAEPSYGFMLRYASNVDARQFQFLLDFFKEKLQKTGYQVYASDRKVFDRGKFVETVERHHLKAKKNLKDYGKKPIDQLYGNVTTELFMIDDQPSYIKFMCNSYSDRAFNPAKDFDELMDFLTEV